MKDKLKRAGDPRVIIAGLLAHRMNWEKVYSQYTCRECIEKYSKLEYWDFSEERRQKEEMNGTDYKKCFRCGNGFEYEGQIFKSSICKYMPGTKGVLVVGAGGTGKSHSLKEVWRVMGFSETDRNFMHSSTGTALGKKDFLEQNKDRPIFMDELSMDTKADRDLFKQIANGKIIHNKSGESSVFDLKGFILSASNFIHTTDRTIDDIMAVTDRFYVIRAKHIAEIPYISDEEIFIDGKPNEELIKRVRDQIDFKNNYRPLEFEDVKRISGDHFAEPIPELSEDQELHVWGNFLKKVREKLTGGFPPRQKDDYFDAVRLMLALGLTLEDDYEFIFEIADSIVTLTPTKIMNLNVMERAILEAIEKGDKTISQIIECLRNFPDEVAIKKKVNSLLVSGLISSKMYEGEALYSVRGVARDIDRR